jgi:hypothetical protein
LKDLVAAADQAHLAADHQAHAIHYATKAAKEHIAELEEVMQTHRRHPPPFRSET